MKLLFFLLDRDAILQKIKSNNGILMVNFIDEIDKCKNNTNRTTMKDVVDNIEYIRTTIGVDHVGFGTDFDGIPRLPIGKELKIIIMK